MSAKPAQLTTGVDVDSVIADLSEVERPVAIAWFALTADGELLRHADGRMKKDLLWGLRRLEHDLLEDDA